MKTAILYSRFSSKTQADGDSLRRQTELAEKFCKLHEIELSELTFQDLGISGWKNTKRDGLESLLEAVETGKIPSDSYILIEATDRLSRRGFKVVLDLVDRLVKTGCKLVTIDNNQIYDATNIGTLSGAISLIVSADLAAQESNRKSERVRAAKTAAKNNRVIQGRQPFWITIKDCKPELNENAGLARRIVQMSLDGKRPLAIVRTLNSENIPSPNGGVWYVAVIRNILRNTILYGAKTYFEARDGEYSPVETVSGLYPKICTIAEFRAITVGKGEKGRKQTGPFSTLLRCECGRPLIAKTKRGADTYRVCGGTIDGACDKKGYYKNVDQIILSQMANIKIPDDKKTHVIEIDEDKIIELENQLAELNISRKANRGKATYQLIIEDIEEVQKELDELLKIKPVINTDITLKSIIDLDDTDKQNTLFRSMIDVVTCKKVSSTKILVLVVFKSGYKTRFFINQSRGINGYKIELKADGKALADWISSNHTGNEEDYID